MTLFKRELCEEKETSVGVGFQHCRVIEGKHGTEPTWYIIRANKLIMDWIERIDSVIRIERVGKVEAAERQFCTAVRLFFSNGDSVSIHTLGWAAHEILDRSFEGGESLLHDLVEDPKQGATRRELEEAMRFFKHHQGAPFKQIRFIENLNEWLLLDCAMMHRKLTGQRLPESKAISVWMAMRFPEIVPLKLPFELPGAIESLRSSWGFDKSKFLQYIEQGTLYPRNNESCP